MRLEFPDEGNIEIYMETLNYIIGDMRESMVDLGCCTAPNTPRLKFKQRTYIDAIDRELDHPGEQQYFVKANILDINPEQKYQVAIASDVIEHLKKEDGYKLLDLMQKISDKQILFTPIGEVWLDGGNDPEDHKSGWIPEDVPNFACISYPNYHKGWGFGGFFFWHCKDIRADFERVKNLFVNKL